MKRQIDVGEAIATNTLPGHCTIKGHFDVIGEPNVRRLPDGLTIEGSLVLRDCPNLVELPRNLCVTKTLSLAGCAGLKSIPSDLVVWRTLILDRCSSLTTLPAFRTTTISCQDCVTLTSVGKCRTLNLNLGGCRNLISLAEGLFAENLNVSGCTRLRCVPHNIKVQWLEMADCGLTSFPKACRNVRLKWRGIGISSDIAFQPESIALNDIFSEPNAALRRVLLERYGFERFMNAANTEVLDHDEDKGGDRRLLMCQMNGDERLVCLQVKCPSTAAVYILRVPPEMETCRHAAAWIAGFDEVEDYAPLLET
jgi:hypothetical protein